MDAAEFDRFADEYRQMHEKNIAITGEKPEFFHEYKIKLLSQWAREANIQAENILDFGSGVGNSTPFLRRYFPGRRVGERGGFTQQPQAGRVSLSWHGEGAAHGRRTNSRIR